MFSSRLQFGTHTLMIIMMQIFARMPQNVHIVHTENGLFFFPFHVGEYRAGRERGVSDGWCEW